MNWQRGIAILWVIVLGGMLRKVADMFPQEFLYAIGMFVVFLVGGALLLAFTLWSVGVLWEWFMDV